MCVQAVCVDAHQRHSVRGPDSPALRLHLHSALCVSSRAFSQSRLLWGSSFVAVVPYTPLIIAEHVFFGQVVDDAVLLAIIAISGLLTIIAVVMLANLLRLHIYLSLFPSP